MTGARWRRLERIAVVLIALHSFAVGFFLLFVTRWGAEFGGWTDVRTLFFPRQAGIFHFVVATGYLLEYSRSRGITLLLTAKLTAVVFLGSMTWLDGGPWAVPFSAAVDGAMGLFMLVLRTRTRRV